MRDFIEQYKKADTTSDFVWEQLSRYNLLEPEGLGRNPYWLKLIVENRAFAGSKGQILNNAVDKLLRREFDKPPSKRTNWVRHQDVAEALQIRETKFGFAWLGYYLAKTDGILLSEDNALGLLEAYLGSRKSIGSLTSQDLLGLGRDALILTYAPGPVQFRHRLLAEYGAAWTLARLPQDEAKQEIDAHASSSAWWETFVILAGLLNDLPVAGANGFNINHVTLVQTILGGGDDTQRLLLAVALLRTSQEPHPALSTSILTTLMRSLQAGTTTAHEQAVSQLAGVIPDELIDALAEQFQNDNTHSNHIIKLIGCIKTQKAATALLSGFTLGKSRSIDHALIAALVKIGEPAIEPIIATLERCILYKERRGRFTNKGQPVRISIHTYRRVLAGSLNTLSKVPDVRATSTLIRCLDIHSHTSRVKTALVKLGLSAVEPLLTALTTSAESRRAIVEVLAELKDTRAVDPLINILRDNAEPEDMRAAAASALASIGDPHGVQHVVSTLSECYELHQWEVLSSAASRALESVTSEAALGILVETVRASNIDWHIRSAAAKALANFSQGRAVSVLIECLGEPTSLLHPTCRNSLIEIGKSNAAGIFEVLGSTKPRLRIILIEILGATENVRVIPALTALAIDKTEEHSIRLAAISALGNFANSGAVESLSAVLKSSEADEATRLLVVEALGKIGDELAAKHLADVQQLNSKAQAEPQYTLSYIGEQSAATDILLEELRKMRFKFPDPKQPKDPKVLLAENMRVLSRPDRNMPIIPTEIFELLLASGPREEQPSGGELVNPLRPPLFTGRKSPVIPQLHLMTAHMHALNELMQLGDATAVTSIIPILSNKNANRSVRLLAITALTKLDRNISVAPLILVAKRIGDDLPVRLAAISSLRDISSNVEHNLQLRIVSILEALIHDGQQQLSQEAGSALEYVKRQLG
ncbi:MAG TPA: HEAT repeat domain-containing protein [Chloroflexia bacterium]|nr:HEAT repeat domain-containing protein [Chloroflexia bacterium]